MPHAATELVLEERVPDAAPLFAHPGWRERLPWVFQATTGRGEGFDLSFFGRTPAGVVQENWKRVRAAAGFARVAHARQVHGREILSHDGGSPGLFLAASGDGHITRAAGVLLAVSVADCVPVFVVDTQARAIALLHAGWRGAAAGILEAGIERMRRESGAEAGALAVHLGPAICGRCYEVGPEVHDALGLAVPAGPAPVDLRAELARRARALGVADVSVSGHCTRCGGEAGAASPFYSHRGGCAERQMALLGIVAERRPLVSGVEAR